MTRVEGIWVELMLYCKECEVVEQLKLVEGTDKIVIDKGLFTDRITISGEYVCECCGTHYIFTSTIESDNSDDSLIKKE